jgi:hypothetical protein
LVLAIMATKLRSCIVQRMPGIPIFAQIDDELGLRKAEYAYLRRCFAITPAASPIVN